MARAGPLFITSMPQGLLVLISSVASTIQGTPLTWRTRFSSSQPPRLRRSYMVIFQPRSGRLQWQLCDLCDGLTCGFLFLLDRYFHQLPLPYISRTQQSRLLRCFALVLYVFACALEALVLARIHLKFGSLKMWSLVQVVVRGSTIEDSKIPFGSGHDL